MRLVSAGGGQLACRVSLARLRRSARVRAPDKGEPAKGRGRLVLWQGTFEAPALRLRSRGGGKGQTVRDWLLIAAVVVLPFVGAALSRLYKRSEPRQEPSEHGGDRERRWRRSSRGVALAIPALA